MRIRNRLPNQQDSLKLFAAVVFPIHLWTIIVTLQQVPTYLLHLSISEIFGIIAYSLAFAFIESIIITVVFIFIGAVLPKRIFRDRIIAYGATFTPMALIIAYSIQIRDYDTFFYFQTYISFLRWIVIWSIGLIPILITYILITKYQKISKFLEKFVDRISVLSLVYIACDLLGIVIIFWRNMF